MDPNKRGNPPFEPSSYAAGLERRVKRHRAWAAEARLNAKLLLDGTPQQQVLARRWWRDCLDQPEVVLAQSQTPHGDS